MYTYILVVTASVENYTLINAHLSSRCAVHKSLLKEDEAEGEGGHEEAVTGVAKHHRKQEREGHDGVQGWREGGEGKGRREGGRREGRTEVEGRR